MELKWLEDLVCVTKTGHFSRAAEVRHITQSAFSRRIKALESWAGTELLDRSQHPVTLTPAGRDFLPHAQEIIRLSNQAQGQASEYARNAKTGVTIACLHTLALFHVPLLIAQLRRKIGAFEASIVAETRTVEEFLDGLINGSSDFFICYQHMAFPFDIGTDDFPRMDIGADRILPFASEAHSNIDLTSDRGDYIPYIEYSGTSYMSRIVEHTLASTPFRKRLRSVYRGTLAESLCTAAINHLGLAWLPESLVAANSRAQVLSCVSDRWSTDLKITIFRSAVNTRPVVDKIWSNLATAQADGFDFFEPR